MKLIDISNLKLTSSMLDEDLYWKLITDSLKKSEDQDEQEEHLVNKISKLTSEEMIGFRLRTDKLLFDTYTSEMWCAGYIINGGCSDDGFEYFRNWVISRGKEVYYKAKENPDSLIEEIEKHEIEEDCDFEAFWYVALEAFNQRTGKDLYEYIDYDNFKTKEGNYPHFDFNWKEEEPDTMKAICPRLYEKYCSE
jgi:Protein of unknown function (DUF4240)